MKIVINNGTTFLVSDEKGNMLEDPEYGLYYHDMRYLRKFNMTLDGKELHLLTSRNVNHFSAAYYLSNPELKGLKANTLSIVRKRSVGEGMNETVEIRNHTTDDVQLELAFDIKVDFADLFEIREYVQSEKGDFKKETKEKSIAYSYSKESYERKTLINFECELKPTFEGHKAIFKIQLPARNSWKVKINVDVGKEKNLHRCDLDSDAMEPSSLEKEREKDLKDWIAKAPNLVTDHDALEHSYNRSMKDLMALRIKDENFDKNLFILAAGIPWFSTLFGRDSLIVAYQTLIIDPFIAKGTLKTLANFQGKEVNKYKEEEPGKILHEIRFGELAFFKKIPHTPYFGTVDATPLFLILACEYFFHTKDKAFINEIMPNIRLAIKWIDEYGDKDKDGYLEYKKATEQGLDNQGWKDSGDSVHFRDGRIAQAPIAICEVQGYVYRAKKSLSRLFAALGDANKSEALGLEADQLKKKFNKDYWMPKDKFFAEALDKDKKKVDSFTSNAGQLLWSGIVDNQKAKYVAQKLMQEDMFSGWGVRTLSKTSHAYNPISYHNGSVWPFDNSLIAEGLRNYGFDDEAKKIIEAMIEAGSHFNHRLPELFSGYPKSEARFPVEYPTSSSPQAWSTGAITLFIKTLFGFKPDQEKDKGFSMNPILLDGMNKLSLNRVPFNDQKLTINVKRDNGRVGYDILTEDQDVKNKNTIRNVVSI